MRINKQAVEKAMDNVSSIDGILLLDDAINYLINNGYNFGEDNDLIYFAKRSKVRQLYGRILKNKKRKYLPLYGQMNICDSAGYNPGGAYCTAEFIRNNETCRFEHFNRIRSTLKTTITRSPLIPEAAAEKLVKAIEEVFNDLMEEKRENAI